MNLKNPNCWSQLTLTDKTRWYFRNFFLKFVWDENFLEIGNFEKMLLPQVLKNANFHPRKGQTL